MGVTPKIGVEIVLGITLITISLCWLLKDAMCCLKKKYDCGTLVANDSSPRSNYNVEKDYDFNVEGNRLAADAAHGDQETAFRDFIITDENDEDLETAGNDDDNSMSRSTSRSATELMSDYQGVALSTPEKLKKAVSRRLSSGELAMRARSTASSINVSARRLHARRNILERNNLLTSGQHIDRGKYFNQEDFGDDLELVNRSTSITGQGDAVSEKDRSRARELQPLDLLDVPIIS